MADPSIGSYAVPGASRPSAAAGGPLASAGARADDAGGDAGEAALATAVAPATTTGVRAEDAGGVRASASDAVAFNRAVSVTEQVGHRPEIHSFRVRVFRATNIRYGMISYGYCQVRVALGEQVRESAPGRHFGANPVFDFTTTLANPGNLPYIVFELFDSMGARQGVTFLPINAFDGGVQSVQRALPLMRAGITVEGIPGEEKPLGKTEIPVSELLVLVEAVPQNDPTTQLSERFTRLINRARNSCKQIRVTIRSLSLNLEGAKLHRKNLRPFVTTGLGLQRENSPMAHLLIERDANEFVFVDPDNKKFDLGGLMPGLGDVYEPLPERGEKGSSAIPAYKMAKGEQLEGLNISYRNAIHVFYYNMDEALELEVYNFHSILANPKCICDVKAPVNELLLKAYGDTEELHDVTSTGIISETLKPRGFGLPNMGQIDFEVEFLQTPIADPDKFETLYRSLGSKIKQEKSEQMASETLLRSLDAGSFANVIQGLAPTIKQTLAEVVNAGAIAKGRIGLLDEQDADQTTRRIESSMRHVFECLGVHEEEQAKMLTCVKRMTVDFSLDVRLRAYRNACSTYGIHPLTPVLALVHQLLHGRHVYGATLRTALEDISCRVSLEKLARGSHVFAILEKSIAEAGRASSIASPDMQFGVVVPGFAKVREFFNRSVTFLVEDAIATDAERRTNMRLTRQLGTLPNIDTDASKDEAHPADVVELQPDVAPQWPLGGAFAFGMLTGVAYAFAVGITAGALYKVETEYICNARKYPQLIDTCLFLHTSRLFDVTDFLSSRNGAITFFSVFFTSTFATSYGQFNDRWRLSREIVVEPINELHTSPHLVICVSGFLVNHGDIWTPWAVDPDYPWTDGQVCCLRFATEHLLLFGNSLANKTSEQAENIMNALLVIISLSNPVSLVQQLLYMLSLEISDMIDIALIRARQAGKALANYLLDYQQGREYTRPVTLCGCSTGCTVVYACLKELLEISKTPNSRRGELACDMIHDVFMAGAFIPLGTKTKWKGLRQIVSGRFIVGYNPTDMVIAKQMVKRGLEYIGAGLGCIHGPGVQNENLTQFVHSHLQYRSQLPLILKQYMPLKVGVDAFL